MDKGVGSEIGGGCKGRATKGGNRAQVQSRTGESEVNRLGNRASAQHSVGSASALLGGGERPTCGARPGNG